jgi:hypothetical protein
MFSFNILIAITLFLLFLLMELFFLKEKFGYLFSFLINSFIIANSKLRMGKDVINFR